jgi:3-deoxy-D-manno-octulosonate 8-phosphate phosphatase KdsC-like HAD superfamily phosphatase
VYFFESDADDDDKFDDVFDMPVLRRSTLKINVRPADELLSQNKKVVVL